RRTGGWLAVVARRPVAADRLNGLGRRALHVRRRRRRDPRATEGIEPAHPRRYRHRRATDLAPRGEGGARGADASRWHFRAAGGEGSRAALADVRGATGGRR